MKIWDFPSLPVQKQIFSIAGQAFDGGYTSGGARIFSPEPGGRAQLELQLAFQVGEWESPLVSWLISKINGAVFKVKLTLTPQLVSENVSNFLNGIPWDNNMLWDHNLGWETSEDFLSVLEIALEGSLIVKVDVSEIGNVLKHGHVIGHSNHSYMIDDISYLENVATITVSPPLRKNVALVDKILLRPYFLGVISNGDEIRVTYDAENIGSIQPGRIIFTEVLFNV